MRTITIDAVSDIKTNNLGTSAKIKAGNESFYVNEDPSPLVGKQVEVEITEKTSARGNKYSIAKILKTVSGGASHSWNNYETMAKLAHGLACELEPDGIQADTGTTTIDRSIARAAITNTVMIAFSNGKVDLNDDSDIPF